MNRLWLPLAALIIAMGIAVAEFVYRYPQLPDRVATHFDAGGNVNGWMSKQEFASTSIFVMTMLGFGFGMAIVVASVAPASAFNLPRKDYWLAPERVATTRRMILQRTLWFMAATMTLVAYVSHKVLEVNLQGGGQLAMWTPLGAYLAFTLLWCGEMFWTFCRAPSEEARQATP